MSDKKLTKLQIEVTKNCGTEPPFNNEYWNNKEPGIYVDIVSGEPLFSSKDKYDSGSGWPSFTRPLEKENIVEKEDHSLFSKRIMSILKVEKLYVVSFLIKKIILKIIIKKSKKPIF